MIDPAADRVLADAVSEVLETMLFTTVYGEAEDGGSGGGVEVRLPFGGGRQGEFCLAISPEAARGIAAGFLGVDDESQVNDAQIGDVVCEVANMVCGSLLSRLQPDLAFDLQPPRLATPEEGDRAREYGLRSFDLGNGTLAAGIQFDPS